jgi:hypothetical protein
MKRAIAAYPAARTAAARVHSHLAAHVASTPLEPGRYAASVPEPDTIEAMLDAAFWASLQREEGYIPKISLAWVSPAEAGAALRFERPLSLAAQTLTRLAPAVERPEIHLGISHVAGGLKIWGATRELPAFCLVLEVAAPGLIVVKHTREEEAGKFVNVAVLRGDQLKVIDERAAMMPGCPALVTSLLGLDGEFTHSESMNVLIQLAISMRAHGRGGLLLVVPPGDAWRGSILQPITYALDPPFSALADLMKSIPEEHENRTWRDSLRRAIDGVAGLTAVDGATVITTAHEVLAFGAKIVRRPRHAQASQVLLTEPVEGAKPINAEPAQIGGTRHLAAAQFAHDQRRAIALVASQDGRFTVFGWSPCDRTVHAHRIDALLL